MERVPLGKQPSERLADHADGKRSERSPMTINLAPLLAVLVFAQASPTEQPRVT